jgi:hypothetical protein
MTEPKRTKRVKPDPELVKLADSLLANYRKPEDLIGENGLLKQLTKMLAERALEAEMTEHLGHDKSAAVTNAEGNVALLRMWDKRQAGYKAMGYRMAVTVRPTHLPDPRV